jgi:hypothetical protein
MPNKKKNNSKTVEAIRHDEATRKNMRTGTPFISLYLGGIRDVAAF